MGKNDKTYDKPMKGESAKMFARFQIYDNLPPHERNLQKVVDIINKNRQKSAKSKTTKKITYAAVEGSSTKWFWQERSQLHDIDKRLEQLEKDRTNFNKTNKQVIENLRDIINHCNKLIHEIMANPLKVNGEPYSLASKIKMLYEITNTLKIANEQTRLCYGYSTTNNDVKLNADINTKIESKSTNTIEIIREVDKELADLYEPNTEYKKS